MTRKRRSHTSLHAILALGLVGSSILGCAPRVYEPAPYYDPSPRYDPAPQRGLRITAQRKQSQRQQDRDKADCQRMASGQATSENTWAQMFTSCMGGRGYMVD